MSSRQKENTAVDGDAVERRGGRNADERSWGPGSDRVLANRMRCLHAIQRATGHDLKSPLHATALTVDLLRELVQASEFEDRQRQRGMGYLEVIQAELSRLERAVQTLLAQLGPKEDGERHVDLRRVQREVVSLIEPLAAAKNVEIGAKAPRGMICVLGSRDRLRQAILNVALEALAGPTTGRRGRLAFELRSEGAHAVLEMRADRSGPGTDRENRSAGAEDHTADRTDAAIGHEAARELVRPFRGRLRVDRRASGEVVIRLELPRASDADAEA